METVSTNEIQIQGIGTAKGIAMGKGVLLETKIKNVNPTSIKESEVSKHSKRFYEARNKFNAELDFMTTELKDPDTSEIIDTQKEIINDPEIENNVLDIIENKLLSVDFALYQTFCLFIERLKESGSELFRQRIVDLEELRNRYVGLVSDKKKEISLKKNSIIVTSEISPADFVSYYEDGVAGLIMEKGGVTSHAAIIAKSLGIPCIVNAKKATKLISDKDGVILDGESGLLIINPNKKSQDKYKKKARKAKIEDEVKDKYEKLSETKDGHVFRLMANIEFEAEIPKIKQYSAKGVGLLRTESLLFGKRMRNSVAEQVAFYRNIIQNMDGPLTIRLFDVGGDKLSHKSIDETNPFLGWRGIRLLLDDNELMKNQLLAVLKVAGQFPGRIKILVPMVSVLEEVEKIRKKIELVQQELLSNGNKIDDQVPMGLMVEVPSVALSSNQFAKKVDFFSIGTNDLTQYTLAVDRGNERISALFQHYHPSVLKLIKLTKDGAENAGIDISVCGELAGDEIGAACMFGIGIHELSMLPTSIPKIKTLFGAYTKEEFEEFAVQAIELSTAKEVEDLFYNLFDD